ncbi:MAG: transposase family protein [Planctomycetota bacterium]|nr:transposase family protein [Planctomycetota bacterium]
MDAQATAKIPRVFTAMPDPRNPNRRHKRIDILTIALFAVMAGADGWAGVAKYGRVMPRHTEPEAEQLMLLEKLGLTLPAQPPPRIGSGKLRIPESDDDGPRP